MRRLSDTDAKFEQAFSYYQELLKKEAALDFDDLLTEVLALKPEKVPFLLVDEFQDVNSLQYQLIRAWSQSGRELFVIGDPDQAIYSFRGSNDRSFDRLGEDFPGLVTLRLDENYRSSQPVLGGTLAVISENPGETRILNARRMGGSPIRIVTAASEMSEGIFAAREINRLIGGIDMLDAQDHLDRQDTGGRGRYSFSDVALLFRTHRQEELLELCLQKEGIPYLVVGRGDFLAERTVRGTICFFKTLLELGNQTLQRLCLKLLWNDPEEETAKGRFTSLQETYRPMLARKKPQKIVEAWIRELGFEKDKPMEKFLGSARAYRTMSEFLDSLTLGGEGDLQRCGGKVYTSDAVTLMTLHGAKGLEFPVVMICGVKKGLIPFEAKGPKKGDANEERSQEVSAKGGHEEEKYKEEERRLLYVGMTRAEDELLLITSGQESEFLSCLPQCYVEREKADKRKNSDSGVQMRFDFL